MSSHPRSHPRWTPRAVWRALPHLVVTVALAILGACAPDAATAPHAAPGALRRLVVPAFRSAQVSAGDLHTCALTTAGTVTCWGNNDAEQATPPDGLTNVTQVSAGILYSCAVTSGGAVTCWGLNKQGQATPPVGLGDVTQVSTGRYHTCALTTAGTVTCWGLNYAGQATPPAELTGVTQVSAGYDHTCALTTAGTVRCWGKDYGGRATPPADLNGVTQVAAGGAHTCALTTAGAVRCWGDNTFGALEGTPTGTGYTQVSAGDSHTCAVAGDGTVTCWGWNYYDQATVPAGLTGVTQVSAGFGHTCVVTSGGAVTCWGENGSKQATPPTTRVAPTAAFRAPDSALVGRAFTLALDSAQVPGYPAATAFTYQFDCGTGTYGAAAPSATANCTPAAAGALTVRGKVVDQDGDSTEYTATVAVKRPQTITVTSPLPASAVVTSTFTLAATGGASGNPVVFASQTPGTCTTTGPSGTTLTLTAAGACRVQAAQAGTETYAGAQPKTLTVTVLSAVQGVAQLRAAVVAAGLKADVRRGLTDKLDAAAAALAAGDTAAACGSLSAFQNQVTAQRGKSIPAATANAWLAQAAALRRAAGC